MPAFYHVYLKCGGFITVHASCVKHCSSIDSKEKWVCFFLSGCEVVCSIPQDIIDNFYVFDEYGRRISDWRK